MSKTTKLTKSLIVLEDLAQGPGSVSQVRNGQPITGTPITAQTLPYTGEDDQTMAEALAEALALKFDKASVAQEAGEGEDLVMSQKAVTDAISDAAAAGWLSWGGITGDIENQADLKAALGTKVNKVTGKGLSTNDYTDADKAKLTSLEGSHFRGVYINEAALSEITDPVAGDYADVDAGVGSDAERWIYDASDAKWVEQKSGTTLTASQVKQLYESNADTNAFTDSEKSKLSDAVLQQDLADPAKGAAIISYRDINVLEALDASIRTIATVDDLRQTEPLRIGQVVYVREFYLGHGYGGGLYESVSSSYIGSDAEDTVGGSKWKLIVENNVFPIDRLGASKTDPSVVLSAFLRAIECVREAGSGTVQCPSGEWEINSNPRPLVEVNVSNITFEFVKGCHFKLHGLLLGWYPIAEGIGYENVSFIGEGVVEVMPGHQWHNDFVYVNNIQLRDLTFIRPTSVGHFLDLNGCNNVVIDGITVLGSNVEKPEAPRLFTEFIQIMHATAGSMGWAAKGVEYADMFNNAPTNNVRLSNSVFAPYTDDEGITTYPPRPIGNHVNDAYSRRGAGVIIENCKFTDIIRAYNASRSAWIELPSGIDVRVSGNTFTSTGAGIPTSQSRQSFIKLLGGDPLDSAIVDSNYFHVTSDINVYFIPVQVESCSSVKITSNSFHCATAYSDLVRFDGTVEHAVVSGNTVSSVGRRLIFSGTGNTLRLIACNNRLEFTTQDESEYRSVIQSTGGHTTATGNMIKHPAPGIQCEGNATGVIANNVFIGGTPTLALSNGSLIGNVFHTTTAPVVTLGGVVQSSQGWDFVHVPT